MAPDSFIWSGGGSYAAQSSYERSISLYQCLLKPICYSLQSLEERALVLPTQLVLHNMLLAVTDS